MQGLHKFNARQVYKGSGPKHMRLPKADTCFTSRRYWPAFFVAALLKLPPLFTSFCIRFGRWCSQLRFFFVLKGSVLDVTRLARCSPMLVLSIIRLRICGFMPRYVLVFVSVFFFSPATFASRYFGLFIIHFGSFINFSRRLFFPPFS